MNKTPTSSLPPLEDKELVRKSIHELSSKVAALKDNYHLLIGKYLMVRNTSCTKAYLNLHVVVDYCHHIIRVQTKRIEAMNKLLKKNGKEECWRRWRKRE